MDSKIKVLLVDHGAPSLTYAVINCLYKTQRFELHTLSFGKTPHPFYKHSKYVKTFNYYSIEDYDQAFEIIKENAVKSNVDIVIPLMERTIDIVSRRSGELKSIVHLPSLPTPKILDLIIDKWLFYNWLYSNNYTKIKPLRFDELAERKSAKKISYPFLIKPFWGSDGNGIVVIKNEENYDQIFLKQWPEKEYMLIQPFIEGFDIDISFLAEEGKILAYSIQKSLAKEKNFKYSRYITFIKDEKLLEIASNIIRDLNYSGVAHLDFRYDILNDKYELVDFNARYWSSLLGSLNVGINFPDLACSRALNLDIPIQSYHYENYYETINILRITINTLFNRKNVPVFRNSVLQFFIKDLKAFYFYLHTKSLTKLKIVFRRIN